MVVCFITGVKSTNAPPSYIFMLIIAFGHCLIYVENDSANDGPRSEFISTSLPGKDAYQFYHINDFRQVWKVLLEVVYLISLSSCYLFWYTSTSDPNTTLLDIRRYSEWFSNFSNPLEFRLWSWPRALSKFSSLLSWYKKSYEVGGCFVNMTFTSKLQDKNV